MKLSIICPVYNEAPHIDALVSSLLSDREIEKEIIFADGGSTDGTLQRLEELGKKYVNVFVVSNPRRYTNFAFNTARQHAKGKYIAFIGAHAEYPENYFSIGIQYLEKGECDVVGGPLHQKGRTHTGKAIACCMSSKFGVGNTEFRTENKKKYVDSVAFAIYSRDVFEKAGVMHEDLIINQDDEFHYRLRKSGFRILMIPEMRATYYVRETFFELSGQYFRYGLYKPLVFKKVSSGMRPRHIIPSLFTLYLLSLPLSLYYMFWVIPLLMYLVTDVLFSVLNTGNIIVKLKSILIFPILHTSYGTGFIIGLFK